NLTYTTLNSSCMLWWCLFLVEYRAKCIHIKSARNVLANTFSWFPWMDLPLEGKSATNRSQAVDEEQLFFLITSSSPLLDCFVNLLEPTSWQNPHDMQYLQQQ
ncbi:MAG: hypothetical protein AAGJ35_16395, partial [Myxococcota bacterium]